MSLRISSWAIQRPLIPLMIFIALLLAGVMAYQRLPINNMPSVNVPAVSITIGLPGAAPSEIESQITSRVEAAVSGVGNIKHIYSIVTDGSSNTEIEFQLGTDVHQAMTAVRDQISQARSLMPQSIEEPQIQQVDIDTLPVLTFSVDAPQKSLEETSWLVDDQIMRSLQAVKGVARVQRQGGLEREIRIELNTARLQEYGITAESVNQQLRQTALNWPAGRINEGSQETLIRTIGAPRDVEALSNMPIALPGERSARLHDLGTVRDTTSEPRQLAWMNHEPVVAFAVYRTRSASEVSVEKGVKAVLEHIRQTNPGVKFERIQSQVEFTRESYHSTLWSFLEGALLAAVVVLVFLRNIRATWITALEIPLSVVPTFFVMQWLGFSLNTVSLLALSLVSGILVDDAIVEIENIMRHLNMGKSPYQAAMDAADEIGLAVVATTTVIVAVFVPVSFMRGVVGQYFIQFGLTVAVATLFSLLVARTITPVMAAYFLKPGQHQNMTPVWTRHYRALLTLALRHRGIAMLFALGLLVGTYLIARYIPAGFLPAEDKSQSVLQVELPPGARLADTNRAVQALSAKLLHRPEVKSVYALVGGLDTETNAEGDVRRARLTVQLRPPAERKLDARAFESDVMRELTQIPNTRIAFLNEKGSKEIIFILSSDHPELLEKTASAVEQEMRGLPILTDVSSTVPLPRSELIITPVPEQAARLGVSTEAIASTMRVATMGDLNANLIRFNTGDRQIPVRVLLDTTARNDVTAIGNLQVPSNNEQVVPLSAVANIALGAGPTRLDRYERQRQITLEANLKNTTLGDALTAIDQLPTMRHLPAGVHRFDTGDAELLAEMFDSFSIAMTAGVVMVFGVLVLLFRTILQPLTIMMALPLSVCGALLALLLSGSGLSLPAVIGILMLMGIVGKNGILLVDCIIERRKDGLERYDAILGACQQRAQPIVMTTLAMIAGMAPVVFGIGAGTSFRAPIATAVIGGLLTSTALSLLFVPVIYSLMDDFENWFTPKLRRLTTLEAAKTKA